MKKLKNLKGKFLIVHFLDHAIGDDAEITSVWALGELVKIKKKSIILRHWRCSLDGNDECAAILISAIRGLRVLK